MTLILCMNGERANVDLPTSVAEVHTIASALMPGCPIEIADVSGPIPNLTKVHPPRKTGKQIRRPAPEQSGAKNRQDEQG